MAQLLKDQRIYHICLKRRATGKRQGFCTVDPDINIESHRIQLPSRVRHVQWLNDEAQHITTSVSIMPYEMATLPLEHTYIRQAHSTTAPSTPSPSSRQLWKVTASCDT
ncbi:hypothetical protein DTO021D3_7754 [Paecilomyces variotii]|nr:hypothetical protein DTO032I3_3964 [Paecilomyces variotii]KAJ9275336.1 hypothetical protein DTO021D3_7754 [Paecilomyces variotii]KAJ9339516.1 hypothetical protein DTO027B6_7979 [Paecilomyces variotii]KAJ9380010.1 hypothetical protein DTO032I4_6974 [Paecilomyces variotii]